MIRLSPQSLGKIPNWRHELYKYVSSKDKTSKASLRSLVLRPSIAADLVILISFMSNFTSNSVTHWKLNEEVLILHFSFSHFSL